MKLLNRLKIFVEIELPAIILIVLLMFNHLNMLSVYVTLFFYILIGVIIFVREYEPEWYCKIIYKNSFNPTNHKHIKLTDALLFATFWAVILYFCFILSLAMKLLDKLEKRS